MRMVETIRSRMWKVLLWSPVIGFAMNYSSCASSGALLHPLSVLTNSDLSTFTDTSVTFAIEVPIAVEDFPERLVLSCHS